MNMGEIFETKLNIKSEVEEQLPEVRKIKQERKFECEICNKKFVHLQHLQNHKPLHTGIKPFECALCNEKFALKQYLVKHNRKQHPQNVFPNETNPEMVELDKKKNKTKCDVCNKTCKFPSHLKLHMTSHTGQKLHECTMCHRKFARKVYLKTHMKVHLPTELKKPEARYFCTWENCTKVYITAKSLKFHLLDHKNVRDYKCSLCDLSFTSKPVLKQHFRSMHDPDRELYDCNLCGLSFKARRTIINHLKFHEENRKTLPKDYYSDSEKKFECEVCNKKFMIVGSLKHHSRKHTEKTFQCSFCSKKFSAKNVFELHLKHHERQRLMNLKRLELYKEQEKTINNLCEICNKICQSSFHLKLHMTSHTGEKPYECLECNKKFARKIYLRKHMNVHLSTDVKKISVNNSVDTRNETQDTFKIEIKAEIKNEIKDEYIKIENEQSSIGETAILKRIKLEKDELDNVKTEPPTINETVCKEELILFDEN